MTKDSDVPTRQTRKRSAKRAWFLLDLLILAVAIVMGSLVVRAAIRAASIPKERFGTSKVSPSVPALPIDQSPILGSPTATVAVVIFSEFQCEFCAAVGTKTLADLKARYVDPGKVILVFKHVPSENDRPLSLEAAQLAACAAAQGRFWPMHDALFRSSPLINEQMLSLLAKRVGIATDDPSCEPRATLLVVRADQSLAQSVGVETPPVVFVGTVESNRLVKALHRIDGPARIGLLSRLVDSMIVE